jgi:Ser/Thr protein kinase RdoA (MazF antagonist)
MHKTFQKENQAKMPLLSAPIEKEALGIASHIIELAGIRVLAAPERTEYGQQNHNFRIRTSDGDVFLKLAPVLNIGNGHRNSKNALLLISRLDLQGPRYINGGVLQDQNISWIIQSGVKGENLLDYAIKGQTSPRLLYQRMAKAAAEMHLNTASGLSARDCKSIFNKYLSKAHREYQNFIESHLYQGELNNFKSALNSCFLTLLDAQFYCLCHGDLKLDNCIKDKKDLVFVDWDAARISIPEFDLACFKVLHRDNAEFAETFVGAYRRHNIVEDALLYASTAVLTLRQYIYYNSLGLGRTAQTFFELLEQSLRRSH